MILTIKKSKLPILEERKLKLRWLMRKEKIEGDPMCFEWTSRPENDDEQKEGIKNLQLFCISIVRDLFAERFMTNENGIKNTMNMKEIMTRLKN